MGQADEAVADNLQPNLTFEDPRRRKIRCFAYERASPPVAIVRPFVEARLRPLGPPTNFTRRMLIRTSSEPAVGAGTWDNASPSGPAGGCKNTVQLVQGAFHFGALPEAGMSSQCTA